MYCYSIAIANMFALGRDEFMPSDIRNYTCPFHKNSRNLPQGAYGRPFVVVIPCTFKFTATKIPVFLFILKEAF